MMLMTNRKCKVPTLVTKLNLERIIQKRMGLCKMVLSFIK